MTSTKPASKNASANSSPIDPTELPKVTLDGNHWKIAKGIARLRELVYEDIDGGTVYGHQTSYENNLKGVMGELAFAKFLDDLYIEDITAIAPYGDPGWDFKWGDVTIDVKSTGTHMELPDLIVPKEPEPKADVYVLTHRISKRTVRIIGWATKKQLTNKPARRAPGDSLNYIVPPDKLQLFR